jgi:hypothetical protein
VVAALDQARRAGVSGRSLTPRQHLVALGDHREVALGRVIGSGGASASSSSMNSARKKKRSSPSHAVCSPM